MELMGDLDSTTQERGENVVKATIVKIGKMAWRACTFMEGLLGKQTNASDRVRDTVGSTYVNSNEAPSASDTTADTLNTTDHTMAVTSPAEASVLGTVELLENILLHLPMKDLLVGAPRVCKHWHSVHQQSISIRRALFLERLDTDSMPIRINPFLGTIVGWRRQRRYEPHNSLPEWGPPDDMLLTDPPRPFNHDNQWFIHITDTKFDLIMSREHGEDHSFVRKRGCTDSEEGEWKFFVGGLNITACSRLPIDQRKLTLEWRDDQRKAIIDVTSVGDQKSLWVYMEYFHSSVVSLAAIDTLCKRPIKR